MHTCMHYSLTVLALILLYDDQYSFHQRSRSGHIRLPASCNNVTQKMAVFLHIIVNAEWCLPVCCNRELTERVLQLLEMVSTDDVKGRDSFDM